MRMSNSLTGGNCKAWRCGCSQMFPVSYTASRPHAPWWACYGTVSTKETHLQHHDWNLDKLSRLANPQYPTPIQLGPGSANLLTEQNAHFPSLCPQDVSQILHMMRTSPSSRLLVSMALMAILLYKQPKRRGHGVAMVSRSSTPCHPSLRMNTIHWGSKRNHLYSKLMIMYHLHARLQSCLIILWRKSLYWSS